MPTPMSHLPPAGAAVRRAAALSAPVAPHLRIPRAAYISTAVAYSRAFSSIPSCVPTQWRCCALPSHSAPHVTGQRWCSPVNWMGAFPLVTPVAGLFTNAKKSFARGTEEELKAREEREKKESQEFFRRQVDGDGRNTPRARDVEDHLPTKKQLNEELPSAAELEKALKEGMMDMFTMKPDKDEE